MIFVDTWAWIALADRRDRHHAAAQAQHRSFRKEKQTYVTTDFVLGELITYLATALPIAQATAFVGALLEAADAGEHRLVFVSPDQFRRAWDLRLKYADKPDISFTDLTSMVAMRDLGVADVFTGDAHFAQVGLGFRLRP